MIKRKKYTEDVKKRFVIELLSRESSASQISKREGIAYQTLQKWRTEFEANGLESSDEELIRLRRENNDLRQAVADITLENQLLKKVEKVIAQMRRNVG